jgi:hypothetical protein
LSVCYHARLEKREEYENGVIQLFTGPIALSKGVQQFRDEIRWYVLRQLHTCLTDSVAGVKRLCLIACTWRGI